MEYNSKNLIFGTYMDLVDLNTLHTLSTINESDQNQVLLQLTNKLYSKIVSKAIDGIDYGTIPKSRGDISKVDNINDVMECLDIMENILDTYDQKNSPISIVKLAIQNIESRVKIFEKAYTLNIELPIVLYNIMVLDIISSTSFLIATIIEFIKNPKDESYDISYRKLSLVKSKNDVLINSLDKFNKSCSKGDLDKILNYEISNSANHLLGMGALSIVSGVALATIILNILPVLQELVYLYFHTRQNISDFFELQSELIEMNYTSLQYRDTEIENKEMIIEKQKKIADNFKKISNTFQINHNKGVVASQKEIKNNTDKYKITDLMDTKLDSADSSLF